MKRELSLILMGPEGQFIEFKRAVASSLAREISAFANSGGGTILVGVADDGKTVGVRNVNDALARIESIARNCDPPVPVEAKAVKTGDGIDIIMLEVPDGPEKPHSCSEGFFLRSGACTQKMSRNEIIRFLHSTNQVLWDEKACPRFLYPEDFDEDAFRRFCVRASLSDTGMGTDDLLVNLGVASRSDGSLVFNNAGVLFFGKEPTRFHMDAVVDCMLFQGRDKVNILDRKIQNGNLMDNVEQAMVFLKKHLSLRYEIKSLVRREILELPEDALREAVLNAVIHRDYHFNGANISVEIYRDRVEISDPGELPPGMKEADLGKKSVRRNKLLADLFHRLGEVERVGSGILRMRRALLDAGVAPMRFEITGFCTVVFNRQSATESIEATPQVNPQVTPQVAPQVKMLKAIEAEAMGRAEIMIKIGLKDREHFRKEYIIPALESGLIEMTIPDKPNSRLQKYRLTEAGRMELERWKKRGAVID